MLTAGSAGHAVVWNQHVQKADLDECWCGGVLSPMIKSLGGCLYLVYIQVELQHMPNVSKANMGP